MSLLISQRRRAQIASVLAPTLAVASLVGLLSTALALPVDASGITQVQEVGATESTQSTTLAATITSTAGDLLVVTASLRGVSTFASTAVTDTGGDSYTTVLTKTTGTNVTGMFYVANAAAVTSVTVHASATATIVESVQEFSGVSASTPLDVDAGASATSTAPASGSTGTTAQAVELVVAGIGWNSGPTIFAQTSGYTHNSAHQSTPTSLLNNVQSAYLVTSTTGTQAYGATLSASTFWGDIVATFKGAATYATAILADSPAFYYRLGEASGSTMVDSSGNGRNGMYGSGITLGIGGALAGDSDTAVAPASNEVGSYTGGTGEPTGAAAFTLEGWVRTTFTGSQTVVSYGSASVSGESVSLMLSNGFPTGAGEFGLSTNGTNYWFEPAHPVNDGNWHLVDVVYDGSTTLTAYLDGQVVSSQTITAPNTVSGPLDVGSPVWCGGCDTVQGSSTGLDEVAVFGSALTSTHIGNHFAASGDTRPSTPGTVTASAGTNKATVSWTAVSATVPSGQSALASYLVTAYTGSTPVNATAVSPLATSVVLSGLKGSTSYTFHVAGVNSFGAGTAGVSSAITPTGASTTYASTVLTDNPAVYYRLDDGVNVAADSSGNSHVAYYNVDNSDGSSAPGGSAGALPNDPDTATSFTGVSCCWQMPVVDPVPDGLPTSSSARTLEGWVESPGTGWMVSQTGSIFRVGISGLTQLEVQTPTATLRYSTPYQVTDDHWHLIDAVYDGTNSVTIYLDGQSLGTQTGAGSLGSAVGLLINGDGSGNGGFDGSVDEVAVYDSALTSTHIGNHFIASGNVRPGTPAVITPSYGGAAHTVTVSWGVPPPRGGHINYYIVEAYRSGAPVNAIAVPGSRTAIRMTGLAGGVAYTFGVTAENSFGTGTTGMSTKSFTPSGSSSTYASTVLGDTPAVYYRLDDGVNVAADSSGNGHIAYYNVENSDGSSVPGGGTGALANDVDSSTTFTGVACCWTMPVVDPVGTGLPAASTAWTIESWVKTSDVGSVVDLTGGGFLVGIDGPTQLDVITPSTTLNFTTPYQVTDGRWHLIAAVYDGTNSVTMYVDGQSLGTETGAGSFSGSTGLLINGDGNGNHGFDGSVDEVAVYDSALSSTAIANHFSASGDTRPSAPSTVTATAGANQATVSWSASSATVPTGESAVTSYLVTAYTGSTPVNATMTAASTSSVVISGLRGSTSYTFQVKGVNGFGFGSAGTSSAVSPTGTSTTYASTILSDSPAVYYRLDDGVNVAADSSGNGHLALYNLENSDGSSSPGGSASALVSDTDTSTSFTGVACCWTMPVVDPVAAGLPTGSSARTLEGWVESSGAGYMVSQTGGVFRVGISGTTQVQVTTPTATLNFTTPYTVTDGHWHLIDAVYDGTNSVTVYLDGQSLGTQTGAGTLGSATGLLINGDGNGNGGFDGSVDEVAVYDSALTATQAGNHFTASGDTYP